MKAELSNRAAELIREQVAPGVADDAHTAARRRFVSAALAQPAVTRRRHVRSLALAAAVAVLACVVAWRSLLPGTQRLAFSAGDDPGAVGAYLVGVGRELPLRFSDGSVVTLEQGARARVASTTADGASVQVESGSIQAHVVIGPIPVELRRGSLPRARDRHGLPPELGSRRYARDRDAIGIGGRARTRRGARRGRA